MFNLFKSAPARDPGANPNASILKRFTNFVRPVASYSEQIRAEEAMCHIIIYRCLDKVALTFSGINLYIERDPDVPKSFRTTQGTIDNLEAVLKSPADDYNAVQFRYLLALTWAAFGRIPIKIGVAASEAKPNAIYPLLPGITTAKYNNRGQLFAYEYGQGAEAVTIPSRRAATTGFGNYPKQAFAHEIVKPSLTGVQKLVRNNTALNAIGLPAAVITMLMQRAYDTASGHPNTKYIVATEKTLTEPQRNQVKEQFEKREVGEEESGNVMILANTKVQVEKLDNNLSDIHSKLPLDDMARQIAGAFGIPVALLGFAGADGSKFANNYEESRKSFFEDTIIPGYCAPIAAGLTDAFCPEGYVVRADLDTIPALRSSRILAAKDLVPVNFLTDDEKREMCGFGPLTAAQRKQLRDAAAPATEPVNDNSEPDNADEQDDSETRAGT